MLAKTVSLPNWNNSRTGMFLSGPGGVGKSLVTANIALTCNSFYPTILIDGDKYLDSAYTNFGIKPNAGINQKWIAYLNGRGDSLSTREIDELSQKYSYTDIKGNIHYLPMITGSNDLITASPNRWADFLSQLQQKIILIDGGAGTENAGFSMHISADKIYIVVEDNIFAIDDAASLIQTADQNFAALPKVAGLSRVPNLSLIINKLERPAEQIEYIVNYLNLKLELRQLGHLQFGLTPGHKDVFGIPFIQQLAEYSDTSRKLLVTDPGFNRPNEGQNNPAYPFGEIFLNMVTDFADIKKSRPFRLFMSIIPKYFKPKNIVSTTQSKEDQMAVELIHDLRWQPLVNSGKCRLKVSAKAGVGKTNATANEAKLCALNGQRVLVVDNARQQNAGYSHLVTLLKDEREIQERPVALDMSLPLEVAENISVLAFKQDSTVSPAMFVRKFLNKLLLLQDKYDVILIDSSSGIMLRNLYLQMILGKASLFNAIIDPESRNKTGQYMAVLKGLAEKLEPGNSRTVKYDHVFTMFDPATYLAAQSKKDLKDLLGGQQLANDNEELVLLPYDQQLRDNLTCKPQTGTTRRLLVATGKENSLYVRALAGMHN